VHYNLGTFTTQEVYIEIHTSCSSKQGQEHTPSVEKTYMVQCLIIQFNDTKT